MATLKTLYKQFKLKNHESKFTFKEWKEWFGEELANSIKKSKLNKL